MNDQQFQTTESRLDNWARWLRGGGYGGRMLCGGIERFYEPPREDQERYARSAIVPTDWVDAERVDVAITSLIGNPAVYMMRAHYYKRLPEHRICRHLRIDAGMYELMLRRYVSLVWDKLEGMKMEQYPYAKTTLDTARRIRHARGKMLLPAG